MPEFDPAYLWAAIAVLTTGLVLLPGLFILRAYTEERETVQLTETHEEELRADQEKMNEDAENVIADILVNDSKNPTDGYPENARDMELARARRIISQARGIEMDKRFLGEKSENDTVIDMYGHMHGMALIADFVERSCSSEVKQEERREKKLRNVAFGKAIEPLRILSRLTVTGVIFFFVLLAFIVMCFGLMDPED